jgi:hypothetical protein
LTRNPDEGFDTPVDGNFGHRGVRLSSGKGEVPDPARVEAPMIIAPSLARPQAHAKPGKNAYPGAGRCRKKFLGYFPAGFRDEDYVSLERGYKWAAHERWQETLSRRGFGTLLRQGRYADIARHAIQVEARTNLLFSFEKMAIRDAVKSLAGARLFAEGLYAFLYGRGGPERRFAAWIEVLGKLPRRQTRVLTWPVATVWGFLAEPEEHLFLKPTATKSAAGRYGFPFPYRSRPDWETYAAALDLARAVLRDNRDLKPRDMIDAQGFLWVMGSDEYPD